GDVAGVEVVDRPALAERLCELAIVSRLPRPVRRGVMEAEQERLFGSGATRDEFDGAVAQQIGEIAVAVHLGAVLEQVVRAEAVLMREVVDATRQRAEMLVVAALQRPERRRKAEMPFADQRRAVAGSAEARGERGMAGWQADPLVAAHGAADRLLRRAADAVLITTGRERKARRRADRRIGIAAREAQALGRH